MIVNVITVGGLTSSNSPELKSPSCLLHRKQEPKVWIFSPLQARTHTQTHSYSHHFHLEAPGPAHTHLAGKALPRQVAMTSSEDLIMEPTFKKGPSHLVKSPIQARLEKQERRAPAIEEIKAAQEQANANKQVRSAT